MALRALITVADGSTPPHSAITKLNLNSSVFVNGLLTVSEGDTYATATGTCTATARADCNVFIDGYKAVTGVLSPTESNLSCGIITESPLANVFINQIEI